MTGNELLELANVVRQGGSTSEIQRFKTLVTTKESWRVLADLVTTNEASLVSSITSDDNVTAMALMAQCGSLKKSLGYGASPMDDLLIEQVSLSWLRLQASELNLSHACDVKQALFYDKCLTSAQFRFFRACESLVKVRKLVPMR